MWKRLAPRKTQHCPLRNLLAPKFSFSLCYPCDSKVKTMGTLLSAGRKVRRLLAGHVRGPGRHVSIWNCRGWIPVHTLVFSLKGFGRVSVPLWALGFLLTKRQDWVTQCLNYLHCQEVDASFVPGAQTLMGENNQSFLVTLAELGRCHMW